MPWKLNHQAEKKNMVEEIKPDEIRDAVQAVETKPKRKTKARQPREKIQYQEKSKEKENIKEIPPIVSGKQKAAQEPTKASGKAKKERKKYTPKEFSVIGEINDIKKKILYENPEKKWQPKDPYYWQIFLTNQHPQEYRVISAFKSQLEGDKDWPAEKVWKLLDTQAFRAYHGKKFNMIFIKYQRYINLLRWQIVD